MQIIKKVYLAINALWITVSTKLINTTISFVNLIRHQFVLTLLKILNKLFLTLDTNNRQQYKETHTSTDTSQTGQKEEFLSMLIFKELFLADWVLRTQTCGENSPTHCRHSDTGHLEKATHATTKALCPDRWCCHWTRQATGLQRG